MTSKLFTNISLCNTKNASDNTLSIYFFFYIYIFCIVTKIKMNFAMSQIYYSGYITIVNCQSATDIKYSIK